MIVLLTVLGYSSNKTAHAAQMVTGTFVDVTFSEYANSNGVIEKSLVKLLYKMKAVVKLHTI